jgi:flavodoxin
MTKAVRYFSKLGNTKTIAEAIAQGAGVPAVSVTEEPELKESVDILFLGGAPYANIMAPELKEYAEKLDPSKVGKVILFTTSNWSRRTVLALKKMLRGRSITVDDDYFYAHMLHIKGRVDAAKEFGKKE